MKHLVFSQKLAVILSVNLFLISIFSAHASAQNSTRPNQASGKVPARSLPPGAELSTDIRFDPSNVYGRYNSAGEAVATVEDDKLMGPLLGLRMHFKDRLQKQVEQR